MAKTQFYFQRVLLERSQPLDKSSFFRSCVVRELIEINELGILFFSKFYRIYISLCLVIQTPTNIQNIQNQNLEEYELIFVPASNPDILHDPF